jgi:hypothetical protein
MKSFPSENILNDSFKRSTIERMLNDTKMDLTTYMSLLCNSVIKDKQILTTSAQEILMLPEHTRLYECLKKNYSKHIPNSKYFVINKNNSIINIIQFNISYVLLLVNLLQIINHAILFKMYKIILRIY